MLNVKMKSRFMIIVRVIRFVLIGCVVASWPANIVRADEGAAQRSELSGGYFLLEHLGEDESQLPLLLDIKHAPQEIIDFADHVSKTGKLTANKVEHFLDQDRALLANESPLPQIELDVRSSIKAEKQHLLLFGTKNTDFVRALLVSQIEASTYGLNICKVLADKEVSSGRAQELRTLSDRWQAVQTKSYSLLRGY